MLHILRPIHATRGSFASNTATVVSLPIARLKPLLGILYFLRRLPSAKFRITTDDACKYHSIVFGGSLVFSFFDVAIFDAVWAWMLPAE